MSDGGRVTKVLDGPDDTDVPCDCLFCSDLCRQLVEMPNDWGDPGTTGNQNNGFE